MMATSAFNELIFVKDNDLITTDEQEVAKINSSLV